MKEVEQVKIFTGDSPESVEDQYNKWVVDQLAERAQNIAIKDLPLRILDRKPAIRVYDGEETFTLSIFYMRMFLEEHERGNIDRGAPGGTSLSMIGKKR